MNRALLTAAARAALRKLRRPDADAPPEGADDARRSMGAKGRLLRAAGRLWGVAHPTNASGNNMSQR